MKDEYVIINKTSILKRIEELEDERDGFIYNPNKTEDSVCYNSKIRLLKQILSQSTPLIPEIEKAFDAGYDLNTWEQLEIPNEERDYLNTQDYISNLKLDI